MRAFISRASRRVWWLVAVLLVALSLPAPAQQPVQGQPAVADLPPPSWEGLRKDGIHDPRGPAVKEKQEPAEALSKLTPDTTGNMVRWVRALEKGEINPRASIRPGTKIQVYDSDVLLNVQGGMPIVRFPHRQHTEWLDCSNCHDHLFKAQAGANKLSMLAILQGEQCGVCHGAVSFPLTECFRCHSVPRPGQSLTTVPKTLPGVSVAPRSR
jgi:c(7)-type cytochrome triheme protein